MGSKKWYLSKRVWGGVVAVLAGAVHAIDVNFGTQFMSSQIASVLITLASAFGLYGGVVAKDKLVK